MAQDDKRPNERFPRLKPREDGNAPRKGPKFNIYWIWAIIFAVLVGFQFFGSFAPDARPIESEQEFKNNMLEKATWKNWLL
jgi:AFG3 family protein